MNNIKKHWLERSKKYKRDVRGVLPKSFPLWLNRVLHYWMWDKVRRKISKSEKILDLGCGYGRIAKEVLEEFPNAKVNGVDISKTYVEIFNKDLSPRGRAVVSDIRKLPFATNYFDFVFMVTTLMYLTDKNEQRRVAKEIFRVLKPKGNFVFIERNPTGHFLFTLGGIITKIRGQKNKEIQSVSFSSPQMTELIRSSGGIVEEKSGFPFVSLLTPSLYIAYSGQKK